MTEPFVRTILQILQTRLSQWCFFGLMLISYILFMMPTSGISPPVVNDKILHAAIFFVLALHAKIAFFNKSKIQLFIFLSGYGLFTEISQGLVSYREFSIYDWVADIAGLSCGFLVGHIFYHNYSTSTKNPNK